MGMNSPATILVTGATGFVGRHLCTHLTKLGFKIRAAVRSGPNVAKILPGAEVHVIGDIGPDTDWTKLLQGVDVVIHLASRVHVMQDAEQNPLALYRHVNVQGTQKLAQQAVVAGVKRLIFLSSIKVNGELTNESPFTLNSPDNPQDAYAVSKMEAEQLLRRLSEKSSMEVVIFRPPLIYGAGVKANFLRLMSLIERGIPLPFGLIRNKRNLLYVGNLVDAVALAVNHLQAKNKTYLIADKESFSTPELVAALAKSLDKKPSLIPLPPIFLKWMALLSGKAPEIERLSQSLEIDSSQLRDELGWDQPYSAAEGFKRTADYYRYLKVQLADRPGL
jgi:nucleoside-diphosphate-sugar epimerase